jgi:hypothetical protein
MRCNDPVDEEKRCLTNVLVKTAPLLVSEGVCVGDRGAGIIVLVDGN